MGKVVSFLTFSPYRTKKRKKKMLGSMEHTETSKRVRNHKGKVDKNVTWKKASEGTKMVEVAHRQITLFKSVPPSGSLFSFEEKRSTSILPACPTAFLVFENGQAATVRSIWTEQGLESGGGSLKWSLLPPLATVTWKPVERVDIPRSTSQRGLFEELFTIYKRLFEGVNVEKRILFLEIFTSNSLPLL